MSETSSSLLEVKPSRPDSSFIPLLLLFVMSTLLLICLLLLLFCLQTLNELQEMIRQQHQLCVQLQSQFSQLSSLASSPLSVPMPSQSPSFFFSLFDTVGSYTIQILRNTTNLVLNLGKSIFKSNGTSL